MENGNYIKGNGQCTNRRVKIEKLKNKNKKRIMRPVRLFNGHVGILNGPN